MPSKEVWHQEKLGKYAYIKGRIGWRGLKASEYTQDGPYLIAGHHITAGQVNWSACDHISINRYLESREIALEADDIILTKDGTIGRVAFIDKLPDLATINSTMMLIRVSSPLVPRYVYHYLTSDRFQKLVADKVSGSSVPHIFQRDMVELTIPVPSDSEQRYIAEALDSIDAAILHTEALITKLKQIKAGLLHDLLTRGLDENGQLRDAITHPEQFRDSPLGCIPKDWEVITLGDVVARSGELLQTGPFGSQLHAYEYVDVGVPVIMPQDIQDDYISESHIARIPVEKARTLARHLVELNDVVFARRGDLGRCVAIN